MSTSVVTVALRGGVVEQAALAEAVARTQVRDGRAVPVYHDAAVDDGVEGVRGGALDDDVDARRQRAEPRGRGELFRDDQRHSRRDRKALEDLHPGGERVGLLRAERIESAQAKTTHEGDRQSGGAEDQQAGRNDVDATRTGARTAPATITAADTALKIPITRPSASRGTIRASAVSPTTLQETRPAFPITVSDHRFDHRHDRDQPQRERSYAHRPQLLSQLGNPGRPPPSRSTIRTDC